MDYFGIKTPQRDNEAPYIWWIANSRHEAWMSFFQYPSAKREMNAHRLPLAEAIQAYEAIGYECVALDVQEKPNAAEAGIATLRKLAHAVLDARNKEARTAMSLDNAQANFHRFDAEERAHETAMIEASEADRALRDALATHNVELTGSRAASSPVSPESEANEVERRVGGQADASAP